MFQKDDLTIGEKIKFFRQRARVSQTELEKRAGLGIGTLNKIEKNLSKPIPKTIHKIAVALKLDGKETAYLFEVNFYIMGTEK